jgi:hypothetical protein
MPEAQKATPIRENMVNDIIASHARAAAEMRNFHLRMREAGIKGPIKPAQKERAKRLLGILGGFRDKLKDKAKQILMGGEDLDASKEVQNISIALYLEEFLNEAHNRALRANISRDYAVVLSTVDMVNKFLNDDYFYKSHGEIALNFMVLKASLDICADIYHINSMELDDAVKKYKPAAKEFVTSERTVKPKESELNVWGFVSSRLSYLEPRMRGDESVFKDELRGIIAKMLINKGPKGISFKDGNTTLTIDASSTGNEKNKQLEEVADALYFALAKDMFFLRIVSQKLTDTGEISASEMDEVKEMAAEGETPRFLTPL